MRVLFVSPIMLYPITKGSATRVLSMARGLSRLGADVVVYCLQYSIANWKTREIQIEKNLILITSGPLHPMLLRQLFSADSVQFEYPFLLPLMLLMKILRRSFILDEHGVEKAFVHELKAIPELPDEPHGKIGFILRRLPFIEPVILALEKLAVRWSRIVFACSKQDADEICETYKVDRSKVMVVPNCADDSFFRDIEPHRYGRPTVLFLGTFDHPPNLHGASMLTRHIMPKVREKIADVQFVFVGRNPPRWLTDQKDGSILVTGEVSDTRPYLRGADVAAIPIFYGSGTRQKAVEFMAAGKPIVSTSKGVEGLDLEDGTHFLRADDFQGFAEAIVRLLREKEMAKSIGLRALEAARRRYAWSAQVATIFNTHRNATR